MEKNECMYIHYTYIKYKEQKMMNIENSYEPHPFPHKLPVLKLPELSCTYMY